MKYLKISNQGLVDVEAFRLLGASSKRNESNKIGMFGSGNKYALAYLLRNNYEVIIYSGETLIEVDTLEKTFRDQTFSVLRFNKKESSITTEFGKDWVLWQALRELYCNAIDEGNHKIEFVNNIAIAENETQIYIKTTSEITKFISEFDNYFSENKQVLFEDSYGNKILSKNSSLPNLNLYRKGVRCFDTNKKSIYDYDFVNIDIEENRLVRYHWEIPSLIWNLVYSCTNKEVIKNVLFNCADSDYIENISSDFASVRTEYMSEEFKEVLKDLTLAPKGLSGLLNIDEIGITTILPTVIFEQSKCVVSNDNLAHKFKVYKDSLYIELDHTPLLDATLNKALDFFKECAYGDIYNYNIKIARFDNKDILGFAEKTTQSIVLSEFALEKGLQTTIETLLEEYIHLKYEVYDETRAFQDVVIRELVNVLKIKNAYLI